MSEQGPINLSEYARVAKESIAIQRKADILQEHGLPAAFIEQAEELRNKGLRVNLYTEVITHAAPTIPKAARSHPLIARAIHVGRNTGTKGPMVSLVLETPFATVSYFHSKQRPLQHTRAYVAMVLPSDGLLFSRQDRIRFGNDRRSSRHTQQDIRRLRRPDEITPEEIQLALYFLFQNR